MLKSLIIVGIISTILGIILFYFVHYYYSIVFILGIPLIILGLILKVGNKSEMKDPSTVYCSHCGSVLTKGTTYCPYCGKKL